MRHRRIENVSILSLGLAALAAAAPWPALAQSNQPSVGQTQTGQASGGATSDLFTSGTVPDAPALRGTAGPGGASSTNAATTQPRPNATRRDTSDAVTGSVRGNVSREVTLPVAQLPLPAEPVVPPLRRRIDDDPYAPLGLRFGNVILLPSIEQSVGYDDNPNRSASNVKGSLFTRTDGELRIQSDWSRHELTGSLRGGYSYYRDVDGANRPDGDGRILYRHDISRQTKATAEARLRIETERPGSPDLVSGVQNRPIIAAYGFELGGSHQFNRLTLGLRGAIDRVEYEDAELGGGGVLDQSDRNYNQYGLKLRASYEASPALQPFVEVSLDTRQRDDDIDRSGFRRSSEGVGVKIGTRIELTRKVTGEISAGYEARRYDDDRLGDLRGPVADAAIIWSVTPLTDVRVNLTSTLDETSITGASGAVTNRAGIEVKHDLRRNLTLLGALSVGRSDYKGADLTEDTFSGSVKLDYKLTRSVLLRSSFTHERLTSTSAGSDYTANIYLVGLRLQR